MRVLQLQALQTHILAKFRLLKWLFTALEVQPDNTLVIKSSGYLIVLSATGVTLVTEGNIRVNGSNILLNSDPIFNPDVQEEDRSRIIESSESIRK